MTSIAQGGTEAPSKREQNKADKRRRIVQAATRLFEEKGFESTTTAEISAAADVGTGTLYLYVDSKEALLVEVFRNRVGAAWKEAFDGCDPEGCIVSQLLQVFGHVTEHHLGDPELSRAYLKELMFVTGPVRTNVDAFMRGFEARLDDLLAAAQHRGELSMEIDRPVLGRNLFALWYYLMQRALTNKTPPEQMPAQLERSFRTSLAGLLAPPPG